MPIYDISPPLSSAIGVWPGDTPLTREVQLDLDRGDNLTLSTLRATVHLGAHADAPSHYAKGAPPIDQRPLEPYLGSCRVLSVAVARGARVGIEALPGAVETERLLLRTGTFPDPNHFNDDFAALAPELIDALHAQGVRLIGIDTPSVDLFSCKTLPAHQALLRADISVLEGLALDGVPDGRYELIALPLRLVGFDASPVRAVLRSTSQPRA